MKKALLIISFLLLISWGSLSFAQEWDVTLSWTVSSSANRTATYLYIKTQSGIIPDGAPQRTLAANDNLYTVSLPAGNWFMVVTAYSSTLGLESTASNEVNVTLPPVPLVEPHSNLNFTVDPTPH